jgi:Delta6-protoilludene synthase
MHSAIRTYPAKQVSGLVVKLLSSKSRTDTCTDGITNYSRFWKNAIKTASTTAQRRFIDSFQLYTDSVVQQAEDRDCHRVRDIQSYFDLRRDTVGAKPSFAILEIHMNLPDEVLNDPTIRLLTDTSIDMIIIGNDLCSYNVE